MEKYAALQTTIVHAPANPKSKIWDFIFCSRKRNDRRNSKRGLGGLGTT
uniref:Uncharacterized protein n=1 Tax=Tetraselmis sp. GSL018 TaxID=582737 RepID=A0A061S5Z6_9CHLO